MAASINLEDILAARERIRDYVHETPVMRCTYLNQLTSLDLFFKCENFQKTGSFKIRGAVNAAKMCDKKDPVLVTHSSGNHGLAIAKAATLCGYSAHVVVAKTTPQVKQDAIRSIGAQITNCPTKSIQDREATTKQVMAEIGPRAYFISSCNHPHIMAGQGTATLELLEQVGRDYPRTQQAGSSLPQLDVVVASVSGGGLISGACVAAKTLSPHIKVIGVEPATADDCAKSLAAGRLIPNPAPPVSVCEGLLMNVSPHPWTVIQKMVDDIVTVTDEETVAAMKLVWERMKLVIEASAACTVAAIMKDEFRQLAGPDVQRVGIILCGGNVDLDNLPWVNNKT